MTKLVLYGVEDRDRRYFEQSFADKNIQFVFQSVPIDLEQINTDTEILSVFVNAPVTREMIERLPNLRLIATRSTGFNHIDVEAAKDHGVAVANVPAYGGATVAEFAFALLLMVTRRMPAVLEESISETPSRSRERGVDLHGKTIGIIGTGSIGQGMIRIAKGFGMEVLGYDAYPDEEQAAALGFRYTSLDELLAQSDIVSLHVPSMPETHHLLNTDRLNQLKPGAIVLNTARGELIDSVALVEALRSGQVGGAGLDVVEDERLLSPSARAAMSQDETAQEHAAALEALLQMPNVILTNHNAFNTDEAIEVINRTTVENILHFLSAKNIHSV